MKKPIATICAAATILAITGCGNENPQAEKTPHIAVGQTTPFDCNGDNCAAAFTIEKLQVGQTCQELGAKYVEYEGAEPNNQRRILINTLVKADSNQDDTYSVALEWDAVTANGVLRPMAQESGCLWDSPTNTEVGGTEVQPGTEKLWSQSFQLPDDATAIRIVDILNGGSWELSL